jgi:hypothetical protein
MLPSCGDETFLQVKHLDFQPILTPLNSSNGSNPAVRSSAIATSFLVGLLIADSLNPHFLHPLPPALMLCSLGLT